MRQPNYPCGVRRLACVVGKRRQAAALHNRGAFTLIEIMVVVVVIAILAAVVIPNIGKAPDQARVAKARSEISSFTTMIESFRLNMRRLPTQEEGLDVLRNPPTSDDVNLWKGPYSPRPIPLDPWGEPYHYYNPAPNGLDEFGVESYGSDRAPGGVDFAKDINSWSNYDEDNGGQ
jgi:general secretion pathway protein G